ncbi:hypothetical protein J3R83DRAFT_13248 [Lanmaoa asiatica]|nr:hypothetical protein J3R83DRAFT_13248 [Lanmaoa asiatica]
MCTNIERAINDLILSDKDVTLANALPAYLQEAGFKKMSPDALIAFEHALDKYPMHRDESRAVLARCISRIATEYWSSKPDILADICRTHCDACAHRLFNLRVETNLKIHGCEHPKEEKEKVPKRRCRSLRTTNRMRIIDDSLIR